MVAQLFCRARSFFSLATTTFGGGVALSLFVDFFHIIGDKTWERKEPTLDRDCASGGWVVEAAGVATSSSESQEVAGLSLVLLELKYTTLFIRGRNSAVYSSSPTFARGLRA